MIKIFITGKLSFLILLFTALSACDSGIADTGTYFSTGLRDIASNNFSRTQSAAPVTDPSLKYDETGSANWPEFLNHIGQIIAQDFG